MKQKIKIAGTSHDKRAKLAPEQRAEIRRLREDEKTPYAKLASRFGVSTRLAFLICNPNAAERVKKQATECQRRRYAKDRVTFQKSVQKYRKHLRQVEEIENQLDAYEELLLHL